MPMRLRFHSAVAANYKSPSQRIRMLSEHWVSLNIYCPNCGDLTVEQHPNNEPAADFFCDECMEDYELKSTGKPVGGKIVDGAYKTMIKKMKQGDNPNLFLLNYTRSSFLVKNFFVIPKHFFSEDSIERRNPLSKTARRAGFTGCSILLKNIPAAGKIYYIRNGMIEPRKRVIATWKKTLFLRNETVKNRGWTLDVMNCIERMGVKKFNLEDVYFFEKELALKHPDNRHVKDKIRQQLQILRDRNYLEFHGRGFYQLV